MTLTSSARGAICPREEVTLTCTVTGGATSLEWSSTAFSMVRFLATEQPPLMRNHGIFTATLTFTPPLADLTSTLRVTATPEAMLNGTVVTCSDQLNPVSITLTLAGGLIFIFDCSCQCCKKCMIVHVVGGGGGGGGVLCLASFQLHLFLAIHKALINAQRAERACYRS